jgi:hypothetical protein
MGERSFQGSSRMKDDQKEKIEEAAVTSVGAGVGGVGGATVGILELAATQGNVTNLSAGMAIGAGAVAGGLAFFFGYKLYRHLRKAKS